MPRLNFTAHEATIHKAIVVSLDLQDFSLFCLHPDPATAATIPKLTKRMFDLLNALLDTLPKSNQETVGFFTTPVEENLRMMKFTGDGALLVWIRGQAENFPQEFCDAIVKVMRDFQQELHQELPAWEKEWRVSRLPKYLRVGITHGTVFALRPPHTLTSFTEPLDYVGYCINLAVRLQNHCPELGFLVQESLHPRLEGLVRLTTKQIKGAMPEPVLAFESDLLTVSQRERKRCFMKDNLHIA